VALPVVGLLLMLGLLFWWANSIIGDDQGTQPTSTVATTPNVALGATNTPPNTAEAGLTPATVVNEPTTAPSGGDATKTGTDTGTGTDTPSQDPTETPTDCDSDFANGDRVRVTEDIFFRSGPDFDQAEPPTVGVDAELEIASDCYEVAKNSDGKEVRFREVTVATEAGDVGNGDQGYVTEEFLELIEE